MMEQIDGQLRYQLAAMSSPCPQSITPDRGSGCYPRFRLPGLSPGIAEKDVITTLNPTCIIDVWPHLRCESSEQVLSVYSLQQLSDPQY